MGVANNAERGDSWIVRELQALRQKIKENAAVNVLNSAEIDEGGLSIVDGGSLTIIDPATNTIVGYIGSFVGGFGVVFTRPNGNVALQIFGGFFGVRDNASNIVFSDDEVSGSGIATPYIPAGVFADITPPTNTTTSATFSAMQWADSFQQHPKVTASVLVQTSTGTAGEIRMTVGGVQVGPTVSIPAASFGQFTIPASVWPDGTYAFSQRTTVQLEARRVSGTGTVGVRGLGCWGVQS